MTGIDDVFERIVREVVRDELQQVLAQMRDLVAQAQTVERRALSIAESAERWNVSAKTIQRRIDAGDLNVVRIGTRIVVPVEALDALFMTEKAS